jgi:ssRNA-specific RNase YbeY (16S rRNA maturation enzyme)
VVHGVLHLDERHYDHAEHSEGVVMRRREQELLSRFRELEQRS